MGVDVETYLTAKEVALFLKLSLQTIRRYTMNKEIPFHKINRVVRYKKSEIEIWVEKRAAQNSSLEGDLFRDTKNGEKND
jgi:excisionase family DNA binding protein